MAQTKMSYPSGAGKRIQSRSGSAEGQTAQADVNGRRIPPLCSALRVRPLHDQDLEQRPQVGEGPYS